MTEMALQAVLTTSAIAFNTNKDYEAQKQTDLLSRGTGVPLLGNTSSGMMAARGGELPPKPRCR